ncbi:dynamin family protein [Kitasatospora sp. NPDC058965]|uniref:dynamin family protein n=1 Tax=Kitasatospora sp. NPDC058965 TaxID=3346682 RepID=UPI0036806075
MRAFGDLRRAVLDLFDRIEALAAASAYAPRAAVDRAAAARTRVEEGRLTVVVCGEFKRGKSTLLGALLREPELFPADTLPATNAVTVVRWGATETITAVLADPGGTGAERRIPLTRDRIAEYVTEEGNPGNARAVVALEIETPLPALDSGLVFVDTPGVGGVQDEHTATTLAFLPKADALLYVLDTERPILSSDIDFLDRALSSARLTGTEDSLVAVLTKLDLTTEAAVLLREAEAALAALAGRPVTVVGVSARAEARHRRTGDPAARAAGNFAALESALWDALGRRRVKALLGDGLGAQQELARAVLAPLDAAEQAAQDRTGKVLDDLRRRAKDRSDHLDRLQANRAQWEATLNQRLQEAADTVALTVLTKLEANWTRFQEVYLPEALTTGDTDRLTERLAADLSVLLGDALALADRAAAAAVAAFGVEAGITVAAPAPPDLPTVPPPALPNAPGFVPQSIRNSGILVARSTAAASSIGGTVGGVLGSLLLPGLGTVGGAALGSAIGSAVGGVLGYRSSATMVRDQRTETRRTNLLRLFLPSHPAQQAHLHGLLRMRFAALRPAAVGELRSRIESERQVAQNTLRALRDEEQAQQARRSADSRAHREQRAPLEAFLTENAALLKEVLGFGRPAQAQQPPAGAAAGGAPAVSPVPAPAVSPAPAPAVVPAPAPAVSPAPAPAVVPASAPSAVPAPASGAVPVPAPAVVPVPAPGAVPPATGDDGSWADE